MDANLIYTLTVAIECNAYSKSATIIHCLLSSRVAAVDSNEMQLKISFDFAIDTTRALQNHYEQHQSGGRRHPIQMYNNQQYQQQNRKERREELNH